jgi:hypothetical protein
MSPAALQAGASTGLGVMGTSAISSLERAAFGDGRGMMGATGSLISGQ